MTMRTWTLSTITVTALAGSLIADHIVPRHVFGGATFADSAKHNIRATLGEPVSVIGAAPRHLIIAGFWASGAGASSTRSDLNCDAVVNAGDVPAFVLALVDSARYAAEYPMCSAARADLNADGVANGLDIPRFAALLTGP